MFPKAPPHEFIDAALRVTVDDHGQGIADVGDGIDVIERAGRHDGKPEEPSFRPRSRDRQITHSLDLTVSA